MEDLFDPYRFCSLLIVQRFPLWRRGSASAVQSGERGRSVSMRSLFVGLAYFIPTALAVTFMLWVFWNFCKQSMRRQRRRR